MSIADSANFGQLWPGEPVEQAADIIMNRFDLDEAQALEVLRRMSQNSGTQMCVVAEQLISHTVPDKAEAEYILHRAAHD
jgi:hypothetical protein